MVKKLLFPRKHLILTLESPSETTIKFRVPGWSRNEVLPSDLYAFTETSTAQPILTINGEKANVSVENGFLI